ncbi:hypothetical protein Dsin_030921 [Dipteronia sinensis]|uniref:Uncharacterized protein n=1 Tax=Dipteronia sinensis TaxID=43782 RepID=A0AAE0DSW6_9ROSI|nr:hypothetical protein Dsin_030921 [Dipteronia sinensis]
MLKALQHLQVRYIIRWFPQMALGVPTGPHGAFRDYQVDAITLEISPKYSFNNKDRRNDFLLQGGRSELL